MRALLSIKPHFVEKIFNGEKRFEYRKSIFAKRGIKTVVIYATLPVGKIVGEFSIDDILEHPPCELWEITKDFSGIEKSFYDAYFAGRKKAFAIKIKKAVRYPQPIDPYDGGRSKFTAPQSYSYLPKN